MTLSDIAIKNRVFSWMLMAALLVFGGICFWRMGISQLPDVDFPVVNVSVTLQGAAPEIMEVDVVDPIEQALTSVSGITNISATARSGSANITLEFDLSKDIDVAVQEVQNALSRAARRLPKELEAPIVQKTNPEDHPILWLAVTSSRMTETELMTFVRDFVRDRFSTVPGVGEVFMGGYIEPNLRIWLSIDKLRNNALTASDVIQAIGLEHAELPAGRIETAQKEYNLRTLGEAPSVEAFSRLPITRRGGAPNFRLITLGEIARVEEGLADIRRRSRSMGKPAVGLGIRKQAGANSVRVAHAVKERLQEVSTSLPEGTEIGVRFDSTKFIEEATEELNFTLILAAIFTSVVCWLFLGSWSATLNVILAIPTSVVGSFIVLYALGFTLNTFTLLALSLAIGIVVDDAIMVLENIVRHREMGKSRLEAATIGAREITFAALAATAAIIAIFLPVAFMEGLIGKYFVQFGVTLSVAVALSLIEALTLTPMRCSRLLDTSHRTSRLGRAIESSLDFCTGIYRKSLPWLLNHRWVTVTASLLFFIASLFLVRIIKKEFVPAQDQGSLMARLQTPMGSSLAFTDEKLKAVETFFSNRPELDKYYAALGGFGGGDVNTATLFITLKNPSQRPVDPSLGRPLTQQELADVYRKELKQFKGARVTIQDSSLSGFGARRGFPIEFTVQGSDWNQLVESSKKMMKAMEESGLMVDVDSDYRAGMPEVQVIPNRRQAQARGVSVLDIGQTISTMIGGVTAGYFSKGGHRYEVRVQVSPEERDAPSDLEKLLVRNNRGELIPLSEVVTLVETESLQAISRQNRSRAITVHANVAPKSSQAEAIEKVRELSKKVLPEGYFIALSGSAKTFGESFSGLTFALLLGIVIAYMVLGSQFNSFIHPFTVLVALPFSLSGAFLALWLGKQSLNIYSMIGIVLLMGIVKKNSILLVDFTNQLRAEGLGIREALIQACPLRLRPILMTSISTIVGALPAALAIGPGEESRIPMAISIIGGILISTLLTLFVVPCVYSLLSRRERAYPLESSLPAPTKRDASASL